MMDTLEPVLSPGEDSALMPATGPGRHSDRSVKVLWSNPLFSGNSVEAAAVPGDPLTELVEASATAGAPSGLDDVVARAEKSRLWRDAMDMQQTYIYDFDAAMEPDTAGSAPPPRAGTLLGEVDPETVQRANAEANAAAEAAILAAMASMPTIEYRPKPKPPAVVIPTTADSAGRSSAPVSPSGAKDTATGTVLSAPSSPAPTDTKAEKKREKERMKHDKQRQKGAKAPAPAVAAAAAATSTSVTATSPSEVSRAAPLAAKTGATATTAPAAVTVAAAAAAPPRTPSPAAAPEETLRAPTQRAAVAVDEPRAAVAAATADEVAYSTARSAPKTAPSSTDARPVEPRPLSPSHAMANASNAVPLAVHPATTGSASIATAAPETSGDDDRESALRRQHRRLVNSAAAKAALVLEEDGWTHHRCEEWELAPLPIDRMGAQELSKRAYREHFYDQNHELFLSALGDAEPLLLACKYEPHLGEEGKDAMRFLLWTPRGAHHLIVLDRQSGAYDKRKMKIRPKEALALIACELPRPLGQRVLRLQRVADVRRAAPALIGIEDRHHSIFSPTTYKFGILYVKDGDQSEEEMFQNEHGSEDFEEFLNFIGDRVRLKGFRGFAGGLDTKNDTTGLYSVHTYWGEAEIMFHVSTLLPYSRSDPQQVERKRHIGNDACVIIFIDGQRPYSPSTIRSKFNHVCAVVRVHKHTESNTIYQLDLISKDNVPLFDPVGASQTYWEKGPEFFDVLLAKLTNAQKAALRAQEFYGPICRMREQLVSKVVEEFMRAPNGITVKESHLLVRGTAGEVRHKPSALKQLADRLADTRDRIMLRKSSKPAMFKFDYTVPEPHYPPRPARITPAADRSQLSSQHT